MSVRVTSTTMAANKGAGPQVIDISKLNLEQLTTLKNQLDQVREGVLKYMWCGGGACGVTGGGERSGGSGMCL